LLPLPSRDAGLTYPDYPPRGMARLTIKNQSLPPYCLLSLPLRDGEIFAIPKSNPKE